VFSASSTLYGPSLYLAEQWKLAIPVSALVEASSVAFGQSWTPHKCSKEQHTCSCAPSSDINHSSHLVWQEHRNEDVTIGLLCSALRSFAAQASSAPPPPPEKTSYGGLKDEDRIFTNLYRQGDPFIKVTNASCVHPLSSSVGVAFSPAHQLSFHS